MKIVNRVHTTLRKVGNSHVVTVPRPIMREWGLKAGSPLVTYQLDGQLLVIPLAYIGIVGLPPYLKEMDDPQES